MYFSLSLSLYTYVYIYIYIHIHTHHIIYMCISATTKLTIIHAMIITITNGTPGFHINMFFVRVSPPPISGFRRGQFTELRFFHRYPAPEFLNVEFLNQETGCKLYWCVAAKPGEVRGSPIIQVSRIAIVTVISRIATSTTTNRIASSIINNNKRLHIHVSLSLYIYIYIKYIYIYIYIYIST